MPDLTIKILQEIRDEIRETNVRVGKLREDLVGRIDQTNGRLDQTSKRIDNILTGSLGGSAREHTARIGALEGDVAMLKRRTG